MLPLSRSIKMSFFQTITSDFYAAINRYHLTDTNFNHLWFIINQRKYFDLDTNILHIGMARIGKSTAILRGAELNAIYDGQASLPLSFMHTNILWDANQSYEAYKHINHGFIDVDEAYFMADRRESMSFINIKYLQLRNALASKDNITATAMQDLTDLDTRIIKKTDILSLNYARGEGLIFARNHSFPIIRQEIINTEKFEKKPWLLDDFDGALYELKKLRTYIYDVQPPMYPSNDPLWQEYQKVKESEQTKAIARISNAYNRIEAQKTASETENNIKIDEQKLLDVVMQFNKDAEDD